MNVCVPPSVGASKQAGCIPPMSAGKHRVKAEECGPVTPSAGCLYSTDVCLSSDPSIHIHCFLHLLRRHFHPLWWGQEYFYYISPSILPIFILEIVYLYFSSMSQMLLSGFSGNPPGSPICWIHGNIRKQPNTNKRGDVVIVIIAPALLLSYRCSARTGGLTHCYRFYYKPQL